MNSDQVVARSPGLSLRQLDYWCHRGVFGADKARPGRGSRREFDDQDLRIATILAAVAAGWERWCGRRGGAIDLYIEIAHHVRLGESVIDVDMGQGINLSVDTKKIP